VATAVWAWNGHPEVYEGKQYRNIRSLVGGLNDVWFNALVRTEFMEKTGQKTLDDILTSGKPVRIIMKPKGSTVPVVADMLFEALGTSRDKLKAAGSEIVQTNPDQLPSMIRDGRADIYFESTPRGHPATTEAVMGGEVVFVDLPDKVMPFLAKNGLRGGKMGEFFKGQKGPTQSVDFGTQLIANKDLSNELAYLITKTVCENRDAMVAAHKAWEDFKPENAWKPENTGIPLHPGAEKYYKERGWMK
jgi:TRAP transporter TAXI family solute receptor